MSTIKFSAWFVSGLAYIPQPFGDFLAVVNGGAKYRDQNEKGYLSIYSVVTDANKVDLKLIRREQLILNGKELFPRNIVYAGNDDLLFTDAEVGVCRISVKVSMKPTCIIPPKHVNGIRGICLNDKGDIFVAGQESNNVVQYSADGTLIGEIVNESHGLRNPLSLHYDSVRKFLFIGSDRFYASFMYFKM